MTDSVKRAALVNEQEGTKWCPQCRRYVPWGEFGQNKNRPGGMADYCHVCQRLYQLRPARCAGCGVGCKPNAHHGDYAKPLEVIWLCPECHGMRHQIDTSSTFDKAEFYEKFKQSVRVGD